MHAWSLGATVVGFDDSCLAMPEIKHKVNALLGKNADEVVDNICLASANKELRQELAIGGQRTLQEYFSPKSVVNNIIDHIYCDLQT